MESQEIDSWCFWVESGRRIVDSRQFFWKNNSWKKVNELDKDGIWKDAIEQYLPLLLKRMMPELYEDVDFTQSFTFLDKELRDTLQVRRSIKTI